jgi:hypothetical protein
VKADEERVGRLSRISSFIFLLAVAQIMAAMDFTTAET